VNFRPHAAAALAGAAAVLGFSPVDFFPATLAALAILVHLWVRAPSPRAAFLAGWLFGLGFFLAGVSWVYVSLHRFGAMPAPLAAFATFGFCAFLALFPALAGWAQARLRAPLAIPALWVLAEWLRGTILTGFPWLSAGYAAIDTPLAGYAPLGGSYLLSLLMVSAAGLLWMIAAGRARWAAVAGFAVTVLGGAALLTIGIVYWIGRGHVDEAVRADLSGGTQSAGEPVERLQLYFGDPNHVGLVRETRVVGYAETLEDRLRDLKYPVELTRTFVGLLAIGFREGRPTETEPEQLRLILRGKAVEGRNGSRTRLRVRVTLVGGGGAVTVKVSDPQLTRRVG